MKGGQAAIKDSVSKERVDVRKHRRIDASQAPAPCARFDRSQLTPSLSKQVLGVGCGELPDQLSGAPEYLKARRKGQLVARAASEKLGSGLRWPPRLASDEKGS